MKRFKTRKEEGKVPHPSSWRGETEYKLFQPRRDGQNWGADTDMFVLTGSSSLKVSEIVFF